MSGCNECGEFGPASPRCHGGETGDMGGIEVKGELECSPLRAGGAEARGARAGGAWAARKRQGHGMATRRHVGARERGWGRCFCRKPPASSLLLNFLLLFCISVSVLLLIPVALLEFISGTKTF